MKIHTISLAIAALSLGACSTLAVPEQDRAAVLKGLGDHIDHCDRTYTFGLGGIGAPGFAGTINCRAQVNDPEAIRNLIREEISKSNAPLSDH